MYSEGAEKTSSMIGVCNDKAMRTWLSRPTTAECSAQRYIEKLNGVGV